MEVLYLDIPKESFFHNLIELVGKVDSGLPSTSANYFCENCSEEFSDSYNEFTVITSEDIGGILEAKRKEARDDHLLKGKGCTINAINQNYGQPNNYLVLYWISQLKKDIKDFQYQGRTFCPELLICRDNKEEEVLFALYKTEQATEDTFKQLLLNNFESHLQKEKSNDLDTLLQDEESLNKNRHLVPKLYGGGRKNNEEAPYVCRWCSPDYLKHKNKGRFQLYGNYKQHFLDKHSSDVPFDEFIKYVRRNDKKWHCTNCGNDFVLSNKVRHQAICQKPVRKGKKSRKGKEDSSSSSAELSDSSSDENQAGTSKQTQQSRKRTKHRTSSEESQQVTPKKVSHATQTLGTESIGVGTPDSVPPSKTQGVAAQTERTESIGVGTSDSVPPSKTQGGAAQTERSQEKSPETHSNIEIPNLRTSSPSTQTEETSYQGSDNSGLSTEPVNLCTIPTKETSGQTQTTNNPTQETSSQPGSFQAHQSKSLGPEAILSEKNDDNEDFSLALESARKRVENWDEEDIDF